MNKYFGVFFLVIIFSGVSFSQTPTKVLRPVPNSGPVIMTNADFENIEFAASMDRIGEISDKELKPRLDRFTSILSAGNRNVEYVFLLHTKKHDEVSHRIKFIYDYLTQKKKIEPSRFSFALTSQIENHMEFWLVPNSRPNIPICNDCDLIPADNDEKLKEVIPATKQDN